jgi:transcriptional regulator with PAS, ATPase and Fis domain
MFNERATQSLAPDARRASIVVGLRAMRDGCEHVLGEAARRWVIGSGDSCDIVIADPYVSQVHCVIERRPSGALVVRDKGSRNGTFIDGSPIEAAELRVGSHLSIGRTTLVAVSAPGSEQPSALESIRGRDPVLRATIDRALRAAQIDCNVLIVGETGTGKDLIARVVHEASRRAAEKLVVVNCGAIPRELIGSELFGHEKGSFTGAHTERDGHFVEADRGTLFLDEIGELPIDLQPHLLRALESRKVRRIGGGTERSVDVRIIAATNRLDGLGTESSRLRLDLYHRLATVVLLVPPLRERLGDLPELVESMLRELAPEHGEKTVSDEAWHMLVSYRWPGNVRELRHAVSRAVALGNDVLVPEDFFPGLRFGRAPDGTPLSSNEPGRLVPYQAMLRTAMEQALAQHGTIRAAAAHLGMAKSTFADKAKAWGLIPRRRIKLPLAKAG